MVKFVSSGQNSAVDNMLFDENFLNEIKMDGEAIVHFYEFKNKSATYGYFMNPNDFLLGHHGLELARRPTGGGMLFHLYDFTFSVVIPKFHPGYSEDVMTNYKYINDKVALAISGFLNKEMDFINLLGDEDLSLDEASKHFCFAKPTKYDVMIQGKKVAGSAQRRKKNGYLHQGSISLFQPDFSFLRSIMPLHFRVCEGMEKNTYVLDNGLLKDAKIRLMDSLQKVFTTL